MISNENIAKTTKLDTVIKLSYKVCLHLVTLEKVMNFLYTYF